MTTKGKTKLILFSDHPGAQTGLARITRDLALQVHEYLGDILDVCCLGYGHTGSRHFPFMVYQWAKNDYWLPTELPWIMDDFAGDDPAILMTIGDIQRFLQVADPLFCTDKGFGAWMKEMRSTGRLKLWGYFPIDAHGIGGKLPPQMGHTLTHYDRRLVPSEWARNIVQRTLPGLQCDVLPHGIDTEVFKPQGTPEAPAMAQAMNLLSAHKVWPQTPLKLNSEALKIGIVATNQSRKDWGLGLEVVAELKKSRPVFVWCHTDVVKREWSILELLGDLGLAMDAVVTTGNLSDEAMSWCYSAMDLTLGIGRGEGFGYPIFESIFCGTPCFVGTYGAQVEFVWDSYLIPPEQYHTEGALNLTRPVYCASEWARRILEAPAIPKLHYHEDLAWKYLWPRFAQWFREGV